MKELLFEMRDRRLLRDIDIFFAMNIAASFDAEEGMLLFALIMNASSAGDTALNITSPESVRFYPLYKDELAKAMDSALIKKLADKGVIASAPETNAPFITNGQSIYMKSFYTDERSVSGFIKASGAKQYEITDKLTQLLDKYFDENNMQKAAALNAALNRFSVISGGPGTGKTYTVFSLLAVLAEMSARPIRIAVCAPTGKAASRLTESIQASREKYKDEPFIKQIPEKAVTIHRLLGITGESREPAFGLHNRLPYDIIVADEVSMVDIRIMAKLTSAVSEEARLILLGDKDQLASVQPGAVLGDICTFAPVDTFTNERSKALSTHAGRELKSGGGEFSDITIMLDKSYRYDSDAGIGLLASASGNGDFDTAMDVLKNDTTGRVSFIEMKEDFEAVAGRYILDNFRKYSTEDDPASAINIFNSFRILTPHTNMDGGTRQINAIALKTIFGAGLADASARFYHGMPIMITENDYSLNLFNGETGLIFGHNDVKACFLHESVKVRHITPARLPEHVPAYAMTVHKSQGSEFDHVLFILPESDSRILTRELFYTAVTRAKSELTVISTEKAVRNCLAGRITRSSGLMQN